MSLPPATMTDLPRTWRSTPDVLPKGIMPLKKLPKGDRWTVLDLFSGAGGFSFGFHAHPGFRVVGAIDVEVGKPSTGHGAIGCNETYAANMQLQPMPLDIATLAPRDLRKALAGVEVDVVIAGPPCTGFSRTVPENHLKDDPRNGLVRKTADLVVALQPQVLVLENARELLCGKFTNHFEALRSVLTRGGYRVVAETHMLTRFGLPQVRERAVVVAVRSGLEPRTLEDLWDGFSLRNEATSVRRAIGHLPPVAAGQPHTSDPLHVSTRVLEPLARQRLRAIPHDGGSWRALYEDPKLRHLLIPSMLRAAQRGRFNHHCDVYGRMSWDRPAPTIKRECAHIGNGRYAHPEQDRLCTVREMATLQGFPSSYKFIATSRKNMYRHIGDAVPPLVSHQVAWTVAWTLTGRRPLMEDVILPGTHLTPTDLRQIECRDPLFARSSSVVG